MSAAHQPKKRSGRDIGFTFEENGTQILPGGQIVPRITGQPNDPEAHHKLIELLQQSIT